MNWAARVLAGVGVVEGLAATTRHVERSRLFAEAAARATELKRTLVVVGDPDAGLHTAIIRAYGCGDVCVDLAGCPACPTAIAADITRPLPFGNDSVVVFISCVFEYVPNLEAAYRELLRVAGGPQNLFVVTVQPWTLTATLYPGATWRGLAYEGRVAMTPVTTARKVLVGGALLGLTYLAVRPLFAEPERVPAAPTPPPALPEV